MLTFLASLGLLAWAVWGMWTLRCALAAQDARLDALGSQPVCWECVEEPCSCDRAAR